MKNRKTGFEYTAIKTSGDWQIMEGINRYGSNTYELWLKGNWRFTYGQEELARGETTGSTIRGLANINPCCPLR